MMRVEWQIAFWIGAFVLLVLLLWLFSGVLLPFAAALALGYLLNPVADRLERLGLSRLGATLVIMVGFVVVLALILVLIMPAFWRQLASFLEALPTYAVKLEDLVTDFSVSVMHDRGATVLE
jgi:predicted PurR-regulated permease PerM